MVDNNFDKIHDLAVKTAKMLNDHKGIDTVLIDVSQVSTWTSFFIITTVMSTGHLRGLVKELRNFLADQSVEIFHKHKQIDDNGWELMDCGDFIVHLMSQEKRDFYDLDKLWHQGDMITLEAR
ncbi:MAG: ribosome silencing factor [Spirochaetia bacterium]|nr:ribosome silencing factor [Spirochaetia bacterium]